MIETRFHKGRWLAQDTKTTCAAYAETREEAIRMVEEMIEPCTYVVSMNITL